MKPQWTLTPSASSNTAPGPRCSHTLTNTDDKAVILIGGGKIEQGTEGFQHYNDVWRWYDNEWTKKTCGGTKFTARRGHTAIYYNHQIIVFGGAGSVSRTQMEDNEPNEDGSTTFAQSTVPRNDVCVLDVTTWTWSVPNTFAHGHTRPSPRRGEPWFSIPLTPLLLP